MLDKLNEQLKFRKNAFENIVLFQKNCLTQNVHSFVLKSVLLTFCYHGLTQNELSSSNLRKKHVLNKLFLTNDYDYDCFERFQTT